MRLRMGVAHCSAIPLCLHMPFHALRTLCPTRVVPLAPRRTLLYPRCTEYRHLDGTAGTFLPREWMADRRGLWADRLDHDPYRRNEFNCENQVEDLTRPGPKARRIYSCAVINVVLKAMVWMTMAMPGSDARGEGRDRG